MRRFSAYELNILNKYKIDPNSITDHHIPVEYVVGQAEFCEHSFKVTKDTLIPRVETEYLVELALHHVSTRHLNYADIGCGSGAIGLSFGIELARRNVSFNATLSDVSDAALEVAKENYHKLKSQLFDNRVMIFRSNLLKSYDKDKKLDLIFANLPYIPTSRLDLLDKSVTNYEPMSALDGGEDGLSLIRELLESTKEYLSSNGVILLEVDDTHFKTEEFEKEWSIEVKNDFNGKIRYWMCTSKK